MNGIITISDGSATIENGEVNCSNINSDLATIQNLTSPTINADNLNNCTLINCDVSADPTVPLGVASKQYIDNLIVGLPTLAGTQTFTGVNTFSNDTEFDGTTNYFQQATFYGYAPKSLIPATTSTHITNKSYVDGQITTLCAKLASANTFTNTNSFTVSCPTASITASGLIDIVNIQYLTKTYGGVYLCKALAGVDNYMIVPITTSRTNLTNFTSQPTTSGALTTAQSGTVVGNYSSLSVNDLDSLYIVYPNYGCIVYLNSGYTGTIYLNYKNTTTGPVVVQPSTTLRGSSIRIYYNDTEQV
jgi:hypothetical protein